MRAQKTPQYYYKNNKCTATAATASSCICWYEEGSGPLPDEKSNSECPIVAWRNKPRKAKEQSK